jgi:hypothetical protein
MNSSTDDRFVVFLRMDLAHADRPDLAERDLFFCDTFAEARRLQRQFRASQGDCVIRFMGSAGGGD